MDGRSRSPRNNLGDMSLTTLEDALLRAVETHISQDDPAHALAHILEVVRLARWILREVEADERIVIAAAYCHDLRSRREVGFEEAVGRSASEAAVILRNLGYSECEIRDVAECIVSASWEHHLAGGKPSSLEASVLRDADWLEAMGAHGIARVFAFAGTYRLPLAFVDGDPEHPARLSATLDGPDPSPFHHFYSKLLWLMPELVTEPARREGSRRHRILVDFLKEYREEMRRTDA